MELVPGFPVRKKISQLNYTTTKTNHMTDGELLVRPVTTGDCERKRGRGTRERKKERKKTDEKTKKTSSFILFNLYIFILVVARVTCTQYFETTLIFLTQVSRYLAPYVHYINLGRL